MTDANGTCNANCKLCLICKANGSHSLVLLLIEVIFIQCLFWFMSSVKILAGW